MSEPEIWDVRPFFRGQQFLALLRGDTVDYRLADVVTARSLHKWETDLPALAHHVGEDADLSLFIRVTRGHPPALVELRLVPGARKGLWVAPEGGAVASFGIYVEFREELHDWRVHAVGPPNLQELPRDVGGHLD